MIVAVFCEVPVFAIADHEYCREPSTVEVGNVTDSQPDGDWLIDTVHSQVDPVPGSAVTLNVPLPPVWGGFAVELAVIDVQLAGGAAGWVMVTMVG